MKLTSLLIVAAILTIIIWCLVFFDKRILRVEEDGLNTLTEHAFYRGVMVGVKKENADSVFNTIKEQNHEFFK